MIIIIWNYLREEKSCLYKNYFLNRLVMFLIVSLILDFVGRFVEVNG